MHIKVGRTRTGSDGTIFVDSALTLPAGQDLPLDWIVGPPDAAGHYHVADIVLLGIDARVMLRGIATSSLSEGNGNLDDVIALFQRAARRALSTEPAGSAAEDASGTSPAQP
jgi:hypothetical protein